MKLVVMTRPGFFVEEDKIITSLFDAGLDCLHLCKPGAMPVYSERLLTLLSEDTHGKISVHEHFYLKDEYKLRGIHLDEEDTPLPAGYRGHYSRTVTTPSLLKEARRKADYVFLAHSFEARDSASIARQAADAGLIDKKVYAFGGINADTIRAARDMGFGGVVVSDDLWDKFNIHTQQDYKELMSHFERLRKAAG